ncbi:MAG TPA: YggS family pyridoxal phosphate-dependent enzyme [Bacteroidales bacterium]
MNIQENLNTLLREIPGGVRLVAVSKYKPVEIIQEAYNAGQRVFGENKAQEMSAKHPLLPQDIEWHFIGHMQTNKVKYIAPFVRLIHSVDSLKLLKEINKQALRNERIIDCLLQFHIAEEESKFGFSMDEVEEMLGGKEYQELKNIRLCGVMGMATFTEDEKQVRKEFIQLRQYFDKIKGKYFSDGEHFMELSMGMSGDFKIAIEEGSTLVRIGTAIFSDR